MPQRPQWGLTEGRTLTVRAHFCSSPGAPACQAPRESAVSLPKPRTPALLLVLFIHASERP